MPTYGLTQDGKAHWYEGDNFPLGLQNSSQPISFCESDAVFMR